MLTTIYKAHREFKVLPAHSSPALYYLCCPALTFRIYTSFCQLEPHELLLLQLPGFQSTTTALAMRILN